MIVELSVTDELSPLTQRMLAKNEAFLRRVSKSLGWWWQKQAKMQVTSGAPGGKQFARRVPHDIRERLQDGYAAKAWYGKMRNAIGYQYVGNGTTLIGWTSGTSAMYGRMHEDGYKRRVTSEMRRKYAAAGVPLGKNKEFIITPARPIFAPVSKLLNPQVSGYVEEKVRSYMTENIQFAKKNRRKYIVYKR